MFGIKWNNKLKPSKVAKPQEDLLAGFDKTPMPRKPMKAYDKPPVNKPKKKDGWADFFNDGESM